MISNLISIVITGYNAGACLASCLNSIYGQTYKDFEIIFINNGSTDDTALILKAYPGVKTINNKSNMGFCFANNQGIRIAKGEYIVTLNSDIILDRNFLSEMGHAAKKNNAGLFGAKILNKYAKNIDSTGLILSSFYRFFDRGRGEKDEGQYDNAYDIFGPCAAAALYKRDMLEDVKYDGEYFDEDFFFLGEDFDMAWRAKNKKWKAGLVPSAICYHERNSTNFNSKFRQYLSFRNRCFLLIKNNDFHLRYLIVFLFYDIPRFISMLFTNKYALKALLEVVRFAPRMLRKRYYR